MSFKRRPGMVEKASILRVPPGIEDSVVLNDGINITHQFPPNPVSIRRRHSDISPKLTVVPRRRSSNASLSMRRSMSPEVNYRSRISSNHALPQLNLAPSRSISNPLPAPAKPVLIINSLEVEIGAEIGKGGFSSVHAAQNLQTRQDYALKIVKLNAANVQDEVRLNLLKEVEILRKLVNVDHVVQLMGYENTENEIQILMELGQGDLRQILSRCSNVTKPLDIDFVRYWGGQVLKAVAAIHAVGIVHADLKPANFIVVNGSLKLCDFGIANAVPEHTSSVRRKNAIGTLLYMAPETLVQTQDESVYKVTRASDMWSCGIILYEMVYMGYPFSDRTYLYRAENCELDEIEHPKTTPADSPVPLALHEIIRDCLHINPGQRTNADSATTSAFFCPVSVDLEAVISMTKNTFKYGHHLGTHNKKIPPGKIEELAQALYQRLCRFNNGSLQQRATTSARQS